MHKSRIEIDNQLLEILIMGSKEALGEDRRDNAVVIDSPWYVSLESHLLLQTKKQL